MVDFPDPVDPTSATVSPGAISKVTPSSTSTPPSPASTPTPSPTSSGVDVP